MESSDGSSSAEPADLPIGAWWRQVLEARHQANNIYMADDCGVAVNSNSIGSLAQTCKAMREVVLQYRQHVGFRMLNLQGAQASGQCLARLQGCAALTLCPWEKHGDYRILHRGNLGAFLDAQSAFYVFLREAHGPALQRISRLHLDRAEVDSAMLAGLAEACPNVTDLTVTGKAEAECFHAFLLYDEQDALASLVHCWPRLQRLACNVDGRVLQPTLDAIGALGDLPQLQSLSMAAGFAFGEWEDEGGADATPFSALTGLTHLSLDLPNAFLPTSADWGWLRSMQQLRSLSLLPLVSLDHALGEALSGLPSLEHLSLGRVDGASILDESAGWHLPTLRSLHLDDPVLGCITAEALAVRRCPQAQLQNDSALLLEVPAGGTLQQLVAKLQALRVLSGRGMLGARASIEVQNFGVDVGSLQQALQHMAAAVHGDEGAGPVLLPHLGGLTVHRDVTPAHVAWLAAHMPRLHIVKCSASMQEAVWGVMGQRSIKLEVFKFRELD